MQADDIEKPLISHDLNVAPDPRNELAGNSGLEGSGVQIGRGSISSPRTHGLVCEQRGALADVHASEGKSVFYWCTVYVIIYQTPLFSQQLPIIVF